MLDTYLDQNGTPIISATTRDCLLGKKSLDLDAITLFEAHQMLFRSVIFQTCVVKHKCCFSPASTPNDQVQNNIAVITSGNRTHDFFMLL